MDTAAVSNGSSASGGAPGAALAAPSHRRWLQFRLRTLLILVVLFCLGLGGWQIYSTHFASYLLAEPVRVGESICIRGRLLDIKGESSIIGTAKVSLPDARAKKGWIIYQSGSARLEKAGRWTYDIECDLQGVPKGGEYRLELSVKGRPRVFRTLTVLPKDDTADDPRAHQVK